MERKERYCKSSGESLDPGSAMHLEPAALSCSVSMMVCRNGHETPAVGRLRQEDDELKPACAATETVAAACLHSLFFSPSGQRFSKAEASLSLYLSTGPSAVGGPQLNKFHCLIHEHLPAHSQGGRS